MNMVGTPLKAVMCSLCTQASAGYGEKYGSGSNVVPCVIEAVMDSTIPKQWNIGTWIIIRSAVERSIWSPMYLPLLTTLTPSPER